MISSRLFILPGLALAKVDPEMANRFMDACLNMGN